MKVLKSLLVLGLLCSVNGMVVKADNEDEKQVETLQMIGENVQVASGSDTENNGEDQTLPENTEYDINEKGEVLVNNIDQFKKAIQDEKVKTVILNNDLDFEDKKTVLDISGKTVDLNGKTVKSNHFKLIFEGIDCVLKNGNIKSNNESDYPLFIGDEGNTNHFIIENVSIIGGGINIYNASDVRLKDVNAKGKAYYAIWADSGAHVIIESGNYSTNGAAILGLADFDDNPKESSIIVLGGIFVSAERPLVLEGERFIPEFKGGSFDIKPNDKYISENYKAYEQADGMFKVAPIATNITLPSTKSIIVGKSIKLDAELTPSNSLDTISWSSENPSIVTVDDNGNVRGIAVGTATITATVNGMTASCVVTVETELTTSPSRPSGGGSSSDSSSNSSATTESGDKVEIETVKPDKVVNETLGKENVITSIQVEKTEEKVEVSVKAGKKLADQTVYIVQQNPDTGAMELVATSVVNESGEAMFTTDSAEVLTITKSLPEGFISTADKENKVTYYINDEGNFQKGWLESEGYWYYFDEENAQMLQERWGASATDWYFMGVDGKMLTNQWVAASDGRWYYVGSDGAMLSNTMIDDCWINEEGIYYSPIYSTEI